MSRRRRRAFNLLALVFLLFAAHRTLTLPLALFAPQYMHMVGQAGTDGISVSPRPLDLLIAEQQAMVVRAPHGEARLNARLAEPGVRIRLFLLELAGRIFEVGLFLCVAIALRCATTAAGAGAGARSAVPWLRRASIAAVGLALVPPFCEAIEPMLLADGIIGPARELFYIDLDAVTRGLLLAAGAWAATWIIAAGSRAQQELAEII